MPDPKFVLLFIDKLFHTVLEVLKMYYLSCDSSSPCTVGLVVTKATQLHSLRGTENSTSNDFFFVVLNPRVSRVLDNVEQYRNSKEDNWKQWAYSFTAINLPQPRIWLQGLGTKDEP